MPVLGAVSFLNSKPLLYALERCLISHDFQIIYDVPSACSDKLARGETEVGLIPSIEYARSPDPYHIVPQICISSYGPVGSVGVFAPQIEQIGKIKTVAVDRNSRSSEALTKIVLKEKYGIEPHFIRCRPDLDSMLQKADAALMIGDSVLDSLTEIPRLDMGKEWTELTGLPFVYAFWSGRRDALPKEDVQTLIQAAEVGTGHIDEISSEYAQHHSGSSEVYKDYLKNKINYILGDREVEGLREFFRYSTRLGLIPDLTGERMPEIRFYNS